MVMSAPTQRKRRRLIGRRPTLDDGPAVDLRDDAHSWWVERDTEQLHAPPRRIRVNPDVEPEGGTRRRERFADTYSTESLFVGPAEFAEREAARRPVAGAGTGEFFRTLGVEPGAEWDDVVAAHRRLAKMFHPDMPGVADGGDTMREVNAAYAGLRELYGR